MKIKVNYNNDDLWCLYSKQRIEIGERYIVVLEDYLDMVIKKEYSYDCLEMLIDEHLEQYDEEPEIFGDD